MSTLRNIQRVKNLQRILKKKKIDAMLVAQPSNRRYLSNYTAGDHGIQESSGVLLIPVTGSPWLLTDSRFTLQAEEEAAGYKVKLYPEGLMKLLKKMLPEKGIRSLAFESHYTLHSTVQNLQKIADKRSITLHPLTNLVEKMRAIKSTEELHLIRESTRKNEQVFQLTYSSIEPGMTEREVALSIELTMRELGAEAPSFETIVAFGENAAKPHAVPTERVLQAGELVLIDMGLIYKGYCSDMTRTFVAGKAKQEFITRHRVVRQAQLAAIEALGPEKTGMEVDAIARQIISDAGYGPFFGHGLGHGVGMAVHEAPSLSPRGKKKLKPGMVVTIEPGMYLPDWGGIRLENMAIITDDGCEVINNDKTFLDI